MTIELNIGVVALCGRACRRIGAQQAHSGRRLRYRARGLSLALTAVFISGAWGCSGFAHQPELDPDAWAPAGIQKAWTPPPGTGTDYAVPFEPASLTPAPGAPGTPPYDLAQLIDLALRNNPQTRRSWEAARAAAAAYGASRAPYYPLVSIESEAGYSRSILPLNAKPGIFKQWQFSPLVELTYTVADFGRRSANAEEARRQLAAANFDFDRKIQDVVFNTQRSFYALGAANAAVTAARQNLELAQTDFAAVTDSLNHGLATQPELLLSKQRVAQARYDLANAQLMVREAQANLAVALGVPADRVPNVESLDNQAVPSGLNEKIEGLIRAAIKERPDLAADAARLRASQAAVDRAKAAWFPVLGLSADYGEQSWNFSFDGPPTVWANQPQYSALLSLQWDLFTGFRRPNDIRRAQAEQQAAGAELDTVALDTIAQVWRAYYEFQSAIAKYQFAQALLSASQEAYAANIETYRHGLSTIVELLTAERDLFSARYTLIQSRADLMTSYAAVAYAVGGSQASKGP